MSQSQPTQSLLDHFSALEYQDGNLSTAVPDQWKQRSHVIDMLAPEEFNPGDEVLVRFRLHIDPFYAGWGWSIDNLRIGPAAGLEDFSIIPDALEIRQPAPELGEHSDEVLAALGYSEEEIANFREAGVI